MKNYQTGVRLCQRGHIYNIEGAPSGSHRVCSWTVEGANCYCAAGETQSCSCDSFAVHPS